MGMSQKNRQWIVSNNPGGWKNDRTEAGLNKLVPLECLYCDKKYNNMGQVRPHLRIHIGMRPFKCKLCDYRIERKCTIMNNHFVLAHHRIGTEDDVITDHDLNDQFEAKVEEDVIEIREIQMKKYRGEPVGEKKKSPRDMGVRTNPIQGGMNYRPLPDVQPSINQNSNRNFNVIQNNSPALASKLSQAYNYQMNMPIPVGAGGFNINQNDNPPISSPSPPKGTIEGYNDIPLDKLLNNDF